MALPASCMVLRMDTAPPPARPEPRFGTQTSALAGLRVLLVEDHAATREGTARFLTAEGAVVIEAHDGGTALELLRRGDVELVLLDMMLPDLDGREVLRALQERRPPGLRGVVVLTGDLNRNGWMRSAASAPTP